MTGIQGIVILGCPTNAFSVGRSSVFFSGGSNFDFGGRTVREVRSSVLGGEL